MSHRPKFYLTTPIYYVNDEPHIGHTYTTIVADTVARYRRLTGFDVRFLTGTDEHGQKIERAARTQAVRPIELADRVVNRFHALWKALSISHDDFIRTTEPRHRLGVEKLVRSMARAGDVYLGSYEGMYCSGCEAFFPESQIVDGRCPDQGHPVERVSEASYFFRLSRYGERLLEHYRRHPGFVRPASRFNEVKAFVESGLRDLSISRTSISWGIPFPDAPGHVVYVWVDALTNYLSALGYGGHEDEALRSFWPAQVHLVGKDILRFHAVYWPAFLMSAGEPLPECVYGHGWWLKDDAKMSKSLGNVVKAEPLLRDFGADALRYFLLREMTFGLDGTYSDEQFLDRYNGDLANDLGNLSSRILALVDSGFGGRLPEPADLPEAAELRAAAAAAHAAWREAFDGYDFSGGLIAVWGLIGETNRYLVRHAPWALARDPSRAERHRAVLRGAAEALLQAAAMTFPAMPVAASEIASRLGALLPEDLSAFRWGLLPATGRIEKRGPLFPRVDRNAYFKETRTVEDSKPVPVPNPPASPAPPTPAAEAGAGLLSIDEFMKTDLRVAIVISAERVEGADKLLKLLVDLGAERRQIVAGIAKAYAPESLVGKRIVVVANLKPARLKGVESQGMLLAADFGGRPIVAVFEEDVPPGTRVR
ncbi:MAG: methionine--tRNA ligase [Acidobacteriia bacterium]|nr:methionine--tRNA ligase [Terriglobia bacterium]